MSNSTSLTERIEGRIDRAAAGAVTIAGRSATAPVFQNMGQIMEFAKIMAVSDIGIRKHLRNNPGACAAVCLQAGRWAMDPFMVANKSYLVNDQIAYESQLIAAVVNTRAPIKGRLKTRFVGEGDARKCIAWATFEGDDEVTEVESPAFGKIMPKHSPLWKTDPDQQLAYYTQRLWARRQVPELLLGVYDLDEMAPAAPAEMRDVTPPRPTRASITAGPMIDVDGPHMPRVYTFVADDGEAREFESPVDYASVFQTALRDASDARAVESVWESNSSELDALRTEGRADLAELIESAYADASDAAIKRDREAIAKAAKNSKSAPLAPPTAQTASADGHRPPDENTSAEAPHSLNLPVATYDHQLAFLTALGARFEHATASDEVRGWYVANEKAINVCAAVESASKKVAAETMRKMDAAIARLEGGA